MLQVYNMNYSTIMGNGIVHYCRYVEKAQTVFKMQCEDYVLVNGVLFRIMYDKADKGEPSLVLCICDALPGLGMTQSYKAH